MINTTGRIFTSATLGGLLLAAPLSSFAQGSGIQMPKHQIAAGTTIKVKLLRDISSQSARTGDHVKVQVSNNDSSGIPTGTVLNGVVTSVTSATPKNAGVLYVRFGTGTGGSSSYNLATGQFSGKKSSSDKSNYTSIGAGAGAIIGYVRKRKLGDAIGGAVLGGGLRRLVRLGLRRRRSVALVLHARDGEDLTDAKVLHVLEVIGLDDRLRGDVIPIRDRLDGVPAPDGVLDIGPSKRRQRHDDGDDSGGNRCAEAHIEPVHTRSGPGEKGPRLSRCNRGRSKARVAGTSITDVGASAPNRPNDPPTF